MSNTHGITNTQLLATTLNPTERTSAAKSANPTPAPANVSVGQGTASTMHLSGAGTLLATTNTDEVRTDKIAALKSAIESGTYNVSAGAVADKLVSHLLE